MFPTDKNLTVKKQVEIYSTRHTNGYYLGWDLESIPEEDRPRVKVTKFLKDQVVTQTVKS